MKKNGNKRIFVLNFFFFFYYSFMAAYLALHFKDGL
jgi:hypothetical protein